MYPDFNDVISKLNDGSEARIPPSRKRVIELVKDIQHLMFPLYFTKPEGTEVDVYLLYDRLVSEIKCACAFSGGRSCVAESLAEEIIRELPVIKSKLSKDIIALYEGDPAAVCPEEVIISYPGFYAISIYRIAHEFYIRKIPLLYRMMTEYAHEKTGIDIHAGATIGEYFFIDHGTGIVIGETTTIGDRVKIYQGVTLGARSFDLDSDGNPVKGVKRHPDIGNNVIIYANATILGGNTRIGDGAIIGGNVWLTSSVEAGKTIYYKG